ncbi:MerR family transcriptional regulator [Paenibacillus sp. 481]|uniref:MerR family transcriptional regulator n=1 Tax=Paenibacillus sp. 481 TaxID=2835869 RepID=UPI001E64EAC4|nr:MerR family transcriptional regulator [Paenibacillus sp. 481]UHA75272.1 MerR family transcriptional regulator [Paenibacillus sp. 481]
MELTIGEVAKFSTYSIRTLHYYDEIGLLTPSIRTESQHRLYTQKDVFKLQQIQVLKQLGFKLKEIQEIMKSSDNDWSHTISNQLQSIELQQSKLEMMKKGLIALQQTIVIEGELNWEILLQLFKMSSITAEERQSLVDSYFNNHEQQILKQNLPTMDDQKWIRVVQDIKQIQHLKPDHPEVQAIMDTFIEMSDALFQGDEELMKKFWEVRRDQERANHMNLYPFEPELIAFIEQALEVWEQQNPVPEPAASM